MDFSFIRHNDEDFGLKEDLFETRLPKCAPDVMDENWSSSTDHILDFGFPMDFLNDQGGFTSLDDLTEHIKMEAEDYAITVPSLPGTLLSHESNAISSNSSDSGLSSDNLEVEMSPPYEPLSPGTPGPWISERGVKRSLAEVKSADIIQPPTKSMCSNDKNPKVIVQKVPQVMTLTNTVQINSNTIQPQKMQYQQQNCRQTSSQQAIVNGIRGNEIKIVKLSPQMFTASNNKPVTIQVKNSNSGAKIQAKPGTLFLNKAKLSEVKKMVRVQASNPRSILIPVSLQDVKELKTFKIVNTTAIRSSNTKINESVETNHNFSVKNIGKPNIYQAVDIKNEVTANDDDFIDHSSDSESIIIEDGYDNDDEYVHDPEAPYPKLILTSEEKRLLGKEGITLPTHYPLTKHEERELKRIRRKIRNKISAQDSRKRKKEYVDGLEERVKQCTEENQTLMKRIKQLQNQNQNLMAQMKKLQSLLTKGTNKTTQPTTCLMVLLLSLALVAAPNLKLGQNPKEGDLEEAVQETILQNRRNLLFNNKDQSTDIFDEEVNMSDIVSAVEFNNERESNAVCKPNSNTYSPSTLGEPKCKKIKLTHSDFIDEIDDENWYLSKRNQVETNLESAVESQGNMEQLQTSGFNIQRGDKAHAVEEYNEHMWLDKDILDMVSPTVNGLYELNMNKIAAGSYASSPEATVIDVTANQMYANQINIKQNASEMRQIKKY